MTCRVIQPTCGEVLDGLRTIEKVAEYLKPEMSDCRHRIDGFGRRRTETVRFGQGKCPEWFSVASRHFGEFLKVPIPSGAYRDAAVLVLRNRILVKRVEWYVHLRCEIFDSFSIKAVTPCPIRIEVHVGRMSGIERSNLPDESGNPWNVPYFRFVLDVPCV